MSEKSLVTLVGDSIGYGRTMQLCEEIWREKEVLRTGKSGGEHTTGPCAFFMVPCPHTIKDEMGHCDICCGAGRITKGVLKLLEKASQK